ncbi:MAG: glycoside hydrolase family 2 TIM barrel-domain containing protein [Verrucomicrobiota bacterium]
MCRFLIAVVSAVFLAPVEAEEVRVIESAAGGFQLFVDGAPFPIKGAGGDGDKRLLAEMGGNTFRTWRIDQDTERLLDEANALGLKVTLGFWLGHERHGFEYDDFEQVADEIENFREAVTRFRNHPALLMWAIGNEMEGFDEGGNPAIWMLIEHLARIAKELDPLHPVMTVTAEIGGDRIEAINRFCPSVDIHGINSYGGISDLGERYRAAGGVKPYVVTEFGPPGSWESKPGKWNRPDELTSTEKATHYLQAHQAIEKDPLCLGGYAFLWGAKQEASATWFGMLLQTGERLAAVDALSQVWTGAPPANRCPVIAEIKSPAAHRELKQGERITVSLECSDPEDDPLNVTWQLTEDWDEIAEGGDFRATPPSFPGALIESTSNQAIFRMPRNGGHYRAYADVIDGQGGAATASLSLKVEGKYDPGPSSRIDLPLTIAGGDPLADQAYAASGWMGDTQKIVLTPDSREDPKIGPTCLKFEFTKPAGWGGIAWQSPAGDWGDRPGGFDLSGAATLSFWARGQHGGEVAEFGIGIIEDDKPFPDSARIGKEFTLGSEWAHYRIDLTRQDLTRIKSGFYIVVKATGLPFEFFVDEVVVE